MLVFFCWSALLPDPEHRTAKNTEAATTHTHTHAHICSSSPKTVFFEMGQGYRVCVWVSVCVCLVVCLVVSWCYLLCVDLGPSSKWIIINTQAIIRPSLIDTLHCPFPYFLLTLSISLTLRQSLSWVHLCLCGVSQHVSSIRLFSSGCAPSQSLTSLTMRMRVIRLGLVIGGNILLDKMVINKGMRFSCMRSKLKL